MLFLALSWPNEAHLPPASCDESKPQHGFVKSAEQLNYGGVDTCHAVCATSSQRRALAIATPRLQPQSPQQTWHQPRFFLGNASRCHLKSWNRNTIISWSGPSKMCYRQSWLNSPWPSWWTGCRWHQPGGGPQEISSAATIPSTSTRLSATASLIELELFEMPLTLEFSNSIHRYVGRLNNPSSQPDRPH